jgi:glycosyltransferase involved in cell wall biosynthesis
MPEQLSILYVGALPPYTGGSALSGALLLGGFAARGHGVRAVAPIVAGEDEFAAANPRLRVERFLVPHFDFDHTKPGGDAYRRDERAAVRTLVRALVAAERPSVVMTGRESFAPYVCDLAAEAGVPFVLRAAGGLSTELLDGTLAPDRARDLVAAFRAASLVVSPAEHLAERLRVALDISNVIAIRNAVDLETFAPGPKSRALLDELRIPGDAVVVLHASNLVASKQPLDVVASAAIVLRENPNAVYVVLGEGPFRAAMEAECRERGLLDRVRFAGWVAYAEMPAYMNLADVFVLPARTETQARVYLEAQACGRLVLASDIPAAREVIVDGESGLLHRVGDVEELARQTLRAAGDPVLRAEIGRRARDHVRRHDLSAAVSAYLDRFAALAARVKSR